MGVLNSKQIDRFHEDGFIVIPDFINHKQVKSYNRLFDKTFAKADIIGKITNEYFATMFNELEEKMTEVFKELFGKKARIGGTQAESKSPNNGLETPWHQDESYWDENKEYNGGALWMTLRDMTEDHGCVEYIKGSHKEKVLEHGNTIFDLNRNIDGFEIADKLIDYSKLVSCPLKAGGVLVHHSRTIHRGGMNISNTSRRTYIVTGGERVSENRKEKRNFSWQQKSPLYNSVVDLIKMDEVEFPLIAGWWEPKETILTGDGGKTLSSLRPGTGSKEMCGWPCSNPRRNKNIEPF